MRNFRLGDHVHVFEAIQEHNRIENLLRALADKEDEAIVKAIKYCERMKMRTAIDLLSALLSRELTAAALKKEEELKPLLPHLEALGFIVKEE